MRCLSCLLLGLTVGPRALHADPLWDAEVRVGYGVAVGGSGAMTSTRPTPLTLAALGSIAIVEEPAVSAYGGLIVETIDRNAAGTMFGFKLRPHDSRVRLAIGGAWIFAPYKLWGATASGGMCGHQSPSLSVCGHVQLTTYVGGTDLAPGHTVTQAQLVIGLVFDAL